MWSRTVSGSLACLVLALACGPATSESDGELENANVGDETLSGSLPVGTELAATGNVNLRSGPTTQSGVLEVVPSGSKVTIVTSEPQNGFYNVKHAGTTGWSSGKYYELTVSASGPLPNGTTLVATGDVNLRSGPGTSFSVIDVVAIGSTVTLVEPNPQGGFYHIDYAGNVGWSSSKFYKEGGSVPPPPSGTLQNIMTFDLTHGAFPTSSHPDVAVHFPPGFSSSDQPSLVVFFHGWDNCVKNAMGSVDTACTPGGSKRVALRLAEQFDAAKVNAVLVAVEVAFDQSSGATGKLANSGEFKAMLVELFDKHLNPLLPTPLSSSGLDRVVVASHSGGYTAVANVLSVGGVPVDEVILFDSLYGQYSTYENWIKNDPSRFSPSSSAPKRFTNIWTASGGTLSLSQQLEQSVAPVLGSNLFYQPDKTHAPTAAQLGKPAVFVYSSQSHYGVPLTYFDDTLAASNIRKLP
jgi:uncharacterized protein YraI